MLGSFFFAPCRAFMATFPPGNGASHTAGAYAVASHRAAALYTYLPTTTLAVANVLTRVLPPALPCVPNGKKINTTTA